MTIEKCTLGGGCFWCLDSVFRNVKGVQLVTSGYAGGSIPNPSYDAVCSGRTGHAEVVQITFDTDQISFETLLDLFFALHDPTTLNRQGADVGTQYRSVIFYHDEKQKAAATAAIDQLNESRVWHEAVVTQLEPLPVYYEAEAYHQDYFAQNPANRYCQLVITPKLDQLRHNYADLLQ